MAGSPALRVNRGIIEELILPKSRDLLIKMSQLLIIRVVYITAFVFVVPFYLMSMARIIIHHAQGNRLHQGDVIQFLLFLTLFGITILLFVLALQREHGFVTIFLAWITLFSIAVEVSLCLSCLL